MTVPRLPYVDPQAITDPEIRHHLELAARRGTPRPESQAVRANVPAVLHAFSAAWEETFYQGVADHAIKELCRLYVAASIGCEYCGAQRSPQAAAAGLAEADLPEILKYKDSDRFTAREKAALTYTDAIAWDASIADDELWEELHRHFTPEELVEIGFFIGLTLGQQRWIKTLGLAHDEVHVDLDAGAIRSG